MDLNFHKKKFANSFFAIIFIFMIAFSFLSRVYAEGYTLTISVFGNEDKKLINELKGTTPCEGLVFKLWNISENYEETSDTSKIVEDLKDKSIEDLDKMYKNTYTSEKTDKEGKTTIKDIKKGIYYAREISNNKNIKVMSFVIIMPMVDDSGKIVDHVFPKASILPQKPEYGSKKFVKTDDSENSIKYLPGAKFLITQKEKGEYIRVKKDGKDYVVESGSDGKFEVKGIKPGIYYLVEVNAPTGYVLLKEPYKFEITNKADESESISRIVNKLIPVEPGKGDIIKTPGLDGGSKKIVIPKTGDVQIYLFSIAGIAMMLMGTYVYRIKE